MSRVQTVPRVNYRDHGCVFFPSVSIDFLLLLVIMCYNAVGDIAQLISKSREINEGLMVLKKKHWAQNFQSQLDLGWNPGCATASCVDTDDPFTLCVWVSKVANGNNHPDVKHLR